MDFISIHAPDEGATNEFDADLYEDGISVHAPDEGATSSRVTYSTPEIYFNPRSR